jgi:pimeloyl-ACP methyl ester carboxylesterase
MPNPVVVIPGYYGTTLIDNVTKKVVWLTLDGILHSGDVLDAIRLDTGDPNRIVADGILKEIEIIGTWSPNVYKGLTMFLGSLGLDLTEFGVDWRRPLGFEIDRLQDKIRRVASGSASNKVDIVTHSHGGLVARKYLEKYGNENLVDKFVTLGVPHKGLLKTFKAMCEGISLFGFSPSHIMKVSRSFPSAYELLPFDAGDGLFKFEGTNADPFSEQGWLINGVSKQMLDEATLSSKQLPSHIPANTTMIFGTHLPTLALAETTNSKTKFSELPIGDGTVPTVSASGRGITATKLARFAIPYGVHSQLFEHPDAQRIVRNVLLDRPMQHFSWSLESNPYTPGKNLGVAADVRDADGNNVNATVKLELKGFNTVELHRVGDGDFFAQMKMPGVPRHIEYRLTVDAPSLPSKIEPQVGIIFAANHF